MITKIMNGYDNPRRRCSFPVDYYQNEPRLITPQQKRTLTDLLCSYISDADELERKLAEIELWRSYGYAIFAPINSGCRR